MTKIFKEGFLIGGTTSITNSEEDSTLDHVPSVSMVYKKINWPVDSNNRISYGTEGQILRSLGNGKTEWTNLGIPSSTEVSESINNWLRQHPEIITIISPNAITTGKIQNSAVTTNKIAHGAVETDNLANRAVTTIKLADSAITSKKIADNAINTNHLIDHSVTSVKIADAAITSRKMTNNSIGTNNLIDGAVSSIKLANSAVTTKKIVDGAITNDKLAQTDGILSDVKRILEVLETDFQILTNLNPRIISGQYINSSNNSIAYQTDMSMTEPIPILKNQIIHIKACGKNTDNAMIATCNASNTTRSTVVTSINSTEHDYSYTATNDGYIVLSFCNSYDYEIRKTWNYASLISAGE